MKGRYMRAADVKRWMCRWKYQIVCIVLGVILYGVSSVGVRVHNEFAEGTLKRGNRGDGPVVYDLVVEGLMEKPFDCQVEVQELQYGEEEIEKVFDQMIQSLPQRICGANESLSRVSSDLELPGWIEEYGIRVSWSSAESDILDSFGQIRIEDCPEEGVTVELTAEMTDGVHYRETTLTVTVYPPVLTQEEQLMAEFQKMVRQQDIQNPQLAEVQLPREYKGRELKYGSAASRDYTVFPVLGVLMAVLFYFKEKQDAEEQKKKRDRQLLLEYADVVYQLMVFIGAGLTVGRAWEQIVKNYELRLQQGRCKASPAYEEMALTYSQIQCGESEGKAIVEFGRRCQLQQYLKLSTLLEQNRRTGTKNLQAILEQEMASAWEQQKNVAKRMGEEAGTKLLAPLFLMLLVVMVIIMVPAMISMG